MIAKPTLFKNDPMINEGMFEGDIAGIAGVEPGVSFYYEYLLRNIT